MGIDKAEAHRCEDRTRGRSSRDSGKRPPVFQRQHQQDGTRDDRQPSQPSLNAGTEMLANEREDQQKRWNKQQFEGQHLDDA